MRQRRVLYNRDVNISRIIVEMETLNDFCGVVHGHLLKPGCASVQLVLEGFENRCAE